MSFRDLRRLAAEIDEQHHESMKTMDDELSDLHFGREPNGAASRRNFLKRAATGGAIAFGATAIPVAAMVPSALAQTPGGTTAGTTPGTTPAAGSSGSTGGTGAKIKGNDLTIVVFAHGIELALVQTYGALVAAGKLDPAAVQTCREFAIHHQDHADALAKLAGSEVRQRANKTLVDSVTPRIRAAATPTDLVTIAHDLENGAAATYEFALGRIENWEAAGTVSTILPVESQHAVAWSMELELSLPQWFNRRETYLPPYQTTTGALDAAQYPAT